jgi:hypothetical protein
MDLICNLTFSELVSLFSLVVLTIYTVVTFFLWKAQTYQFRLSQRPCLWTDDVYLDLHGPFESIQLRLYNTGKLPAFYRIAVAAIEISHHFTGTWYIRPEPRDTAQESAAFPIIPPSSKITDIPGPDFFSMPCPDGYSDKLMEGSSITFRVVVDYGSRPSRFIYRYRATITVHKANLKEQQQVTAVSDMRIETLSWWKRRQSIKN